MIPGTTVLAGTGSEEGAVTTTTPFGVELQQAADKVTATITDKNGAVVRTIDIKPGLSKDDFLDVILLERRKEFAFEGQRRFDLVRTHKLKEAMMAQNPTIGAVVEEKHYLLPIPVTELDANKLLEQTPGW